MFNFLPSGFDLYATVAGILAVVVALWSVFAKTFKAGKNAQKVEDAERYADAVKKAQDAVRARDDVMSGRVPEHDADPNRRG